MLPFKPQPLDQLKARYSVVLKRVFDCTKGIPSPRPGELYSHVFDCEDGLRLIVSRDKESDTSTYLHLSASPHSKETHELFAYSGDAEQVTFIALALERFIEISGDAGPLQFYGFSQRGIPHWRRKEDLTQ